MVAVVSAMAMLDSLYERSLAPYTERLMALLLAVAAGDAMKIAAARVSLANTIAQTNGIADMLGREQGLKRAANVREAVGLDFGKERDYRVKAPPQSILPNVTFKDAIDDILARTPVTIRNAALRSADEVSRIYNTEHAITFAHSAEQAVTERVQTALASAIKKGMTTPEAIAYIRKNVDAVRKDTEEWTRAYAQTVYRTNLNTAMTAGRFRVANDEDVAQVIPAMQFHSAHDEDVRPNHLACDGTIAGVNDPIWQSIAPPLGYNCRCGVDYIDIVMLRRMGLLNKDGSVKRRGPKPGGKADPPPFMHKGRPDLLIYGSAA